MVVNLLKSKNSNMRKKTIVILFLSMSVNTLFAQKTMYDVLLGKENCNLIKKKIVLDSVTRQKQLYINIKGLKYQLSSPFNLIYSDSINISQESILLVLKGNKEIGRLTIIPETAVPLESYNLMMPKDTITFDKQNLKNFENFSSDGDFLPTMLLSPKYFVKLIKHIFKTYEKCPNPLPKERQ